MTTEPQESPSQEAAPTTRPLAALDEALGHIDATWLVPLLQNESPAVLSALVQRAPTTVCLALKSLSWSLATGSVLVPGGPAEDNASPDGPAALRAHVFGPLLDAYLKAPCPNALEPYSADSGEAILDALAHGGADILALSLSGADLRLTARTLAAVGAPWSESISQKLKGPRAVDTKEKALAQWAVAQAGRHETTEVRARLAAVALCRLHKELGANEAEQLPRLAYKLPQVLGRLLSPGAP